MTLFFVISGYVIYMSLGDKSPRCFAWNRFCRLFPVYWVAVLITGSVCRAGDPTLAVPLRDILINLSMVSNVPIVHHLLRVQYVDGVYWTLGIELVFYGLMLACARFRWVDRIDSVCCVWLAFSVIDALFQTIFPGVPSIFRPLTLWHFGPLFVAGILFCQLRRDGQAGRLSRRTLGRYGMIIVSSLLLCFVTQGYLEGTVIGCIYLVFYLCIKNRLALLRNPILLFAGAVSYSFYLVHQNIGYVVITGITDASRQMYLGILGALAVAVGLATLLTFLIERPAQRVLKALGSTGHQVQPGHADSLPA